SVHLRQVGRDRTGHGMLRSGISRLLSRRSGAGATRPFGRCRCASPAAFSGPADDGQNMSVDTLSDSFTTLPDLCARAARAYGDAVFIEDGRTLTFTEFDLLRRRIARAFIASGVEKGDRVMIWGP